MASSFLRPASSGVRQPEAVMTGECSPELRRVVSCVLLLGAVLLPACSTVDRQADATLLAAAASLRHVVPALTSDFLVRHPGPEPMVSYGASGTLCSQVKAGAPVHAVLFAAEAPVDRLVDLGLADVESKTTLASNQLVLVGRSDGPTSKLSSLGSLEPQQRLSIGNPDFVPAGAYAQQLLEALGLWGVLGDRLVYGGDVARSLVYVRRGEAEFGLVYATDVRGQDGLEVLDRADWQGAPQPLVVSALTRLGVEQPRAVLFLEYVRSAEARDIFARFGFGPVPR